MLVIFLLLIVVLIAVVVAFVFIQPSDGDNLPTSISTNNNFLITAYGDYSQYKDDIISASNTLSDIINDKNKIPVKIYIVTGSDGNTLASAMMNDTSNIFSGGVIYIYDDYSGNSSTPYSEILIHEFLHVMGIGTHNIWTDNVLNGNLLNGNVFTNTLTSYNELYNSGTDEQNIPLGTNNAHWHENIFTTEIMTPFTEDIVDLILSKVTGNALIDMGWDINLSSSKFEVP